MNLGAIFTLFRTPHLWAQVQINRDVRPFLRLHFLYSAMESGLLAALKTPISRGELIQQLHVQRPELLDGLLELGVSLKELSRDQDRYKIRGKRARALVADEGDPFVAMLQEYVTIHSSAYRHLAARLAGAPLGDYLGESGTLIARSSRVLEPFIRDFVRAIVRTSEPVRMLDVGCGSGIYLRYAAEANPKLTGVGIDMQDAVARQALANLAEWGIGERFKVMVADIRNPPADLNGPFDLITLFNNVYYFTPEERPVLFCILRSRLAPNGALAIVSLMQGNSVTAIDFDLLLRSTVGCAPLPEVDELIAQLCESGFRHVKKTKLMPEEPVYGIVAT